MPRARLSSAAPDVLSALVGAVAATDAGAGERGLVPQDSRAGARCKCLTCTFLPSRRPMRRRQRLQLLRLHGQGAGGARPDRPPARAAGAGAQAAGGRRAGGAAGEQSPLNAAHAPRRRGAALSAAAHHAARPRSIAAPAAGPAEQHARASGAGRTGRARVPMRQHWRRRQRVASSSAGPSRRAAARRAVSCCPGQLSAMAGAAGRCRWTGAGISRHR